MPLHPAAPDDLHGHVEALAGTLQAVVDLGRGCRPADFDKPTSCPGWSVKDIFSHVVGVEEWLGGEPLPELEVPDYPHIRNEFGRKVEQHVEFRRPLEGQDVVDDLEAVVAERLAWWRNPALTDETIVPGPFGPASALAVLRMRIVDVWTHEQDLRAALGRPGDLDSPAAAIFCDVVFEQLPRIAARAALVPLDHVVILDVTGPVIGRAGVRIDKGPDGRPRGVPLYRGVSHTGHEGEHLATTTITLSTDALARRAAGRGAIDDVHWTYHGDESVARRVLDSLPIVT